MHRSSAAPETTIGFPSGFVGPSPSSSSHCATPHHHNSDALSLGIFTRVNTSVKGQEIVGTRMYSEWATMQQSIQQDLNDLSVLNKFPLVAGKDVAIPIVKHLASNLGISSNAHCEPSRLEEDKDVLWCMEVLSYGLGLPLAEHDTIRDSVNVYCEWLMALLKPKICVPKPVCDDPNHYAQIMIRHFYNVFVPRSDSNADSINRQVVLCHRVLRTLQKIAREAKVLVRETWESMLMLLLAINDALLAPPTVKDDIGDQLCERVVGVLFEIWLLSCTHCFPSPSLWKTFRDMCLNWRHRINLVDQWNRINMALTSKLLRFMYGPSFPELKIGEDDCHFTSVEMTNDCVAQSWFRFLHLLGNPVELCYPAVISNTPKFLHYAITSECVVDPCQHECLDVLPQIFLKAMRGVSVLVDAFLGIANYSVDEFHWAATKVVPTSVVVIQHPSITPPQLRKPSKSFSVTSAATKGGLPKSSLMGLSASKSSNVSSSSSQMSVVHTPTSVLQPHPFPSITVATSESRPPLVSARPRCNSILHLFGSWLFEAALIGSHLPTSSRVEKMKRPSSLVLETRRGSGTSFPENCEIPADLTLQHYESGRAEAIGTLCRIFCAKKTGEDILPVYLARFYLALQQGLRILEQTNGQVLCGIILNSCDLLRLDLDGIMVLVPDIIDALELVLPERELKFRTSFNLSPVELRRASIHLLLSMLPLPLHFRTLPIKELINSGSDRPQLKFQDLRPRLINLLVGALQSETDSLNMQLLLGGLLLSIQDVAMCEAEESVLFQQDGYSNSTAAFLASASVSSDTQSNPISNYGGSSLDDFSDTASESASISSHPDSTYALFVRATYLVCQRLSSSWKMDLNVSLAALELLSGFAKIKIPDQETLECKLPVKWICDYIVNQCSRPPQFHLKDLHSNIVAAFRCITTWLLEHPYLLSDSECLNTVMDVVELGISGSKSHSKLGDFPQMKGDKECKPASMRVRDAAEAVLTYIMEHVGYFPSPSGQASVSSLLDEENLLCYCNGYEGSNPITKTAATQHFKYYVVDNSIVLAILEQPLGNDQDPQPTVTVLMRGPFGRNAWTMQLRHLPRHKSGTKMHPSNPGRPVPMSEHHVRHHGRQRYFPESVNTIQSCKAERSIPSLESLIVDKVAQEHEKLLKLVEQQVAFEERVRKTIEAQRPEYPNPKTECKAPEVCHEFETARLFLNHFGFLSLEFLKQSLDCPSPPLMALNASQSGFVSDLEALDAISNRTNDTAFIFYVKSRQKTSQEILGNIAAANNVHPHFLEFLLSLGWPVDVATHPGWTGHVATSWKTIESAPPSSAGSGSFNTSESIPYDGQKQILYWSDATAEVAFIVPTLKSDRVEPNQAETESAPSSLHFDSSSLDGRSFPSPVIDNYEKPRTLSLDLEKGPIKDKESPSDSRGRKIGRQSSSVVGYDTKVLIIWLERYEDYLTVPIDNLLLETNTGLEAATVTPRSNEKDVVVVFIHALQSGLFRIKLQGQSGKISMAIPLVDGMVVSRRVLGTLVRQTTLNMCLRKRLENDCYYPPHLRRKLRIQDIVHKYGRSLSEPEFYASLFDNQTS